MAHFLLSMVIVANAVVLHWRAGEQPGPSRPPAHAPAPQTVGPDIRRLGNVILATTALVVFLGTVVTAAGPHGGDENAERLDVPLHRAVQLHGAAAMLLVTMVAMMLFLLVRAPSPPEVRRRGRILLGVVVAQAGIGYLQYFTGVPVLLVGAHIAGATALWATAVRFVLGLGRAQDEAAKLEHEVRPEADGRPEVLSASVDGAR
nr:heme A synthase [Actinomycetota bacterium]